MTQPRTMFDTLKKYFGDSPWLTTEFSGQTVLRFNHEGQNGHWVCIAHAREAEDRLVVYSIELTEAPAGRRAALAEFLTRANYGMIIGNFEMDFDDADGEVRFKTSIDVEGDRLTTTLIGQLVKLNIQMMDKYLPGIRAVATTDITPLAAIEQIEGPSQTRDIHL